MTKKTSLRAKTTRVTSKAKLKMKKAKKAVARKVVSRKKPLTKKTPPRPGGKPKTRPATPTSSVGAWPGLPPGYFERGR